VTWSTARVGEIGSVLGPEWWAQWARDPEYGSGWHSVGKHFGIQGFGANISEADAGREIIVPHTETDYGAQEELYIVVRGRARFTIDGEDVELGELDMLHVTHEVTREATALDTPTLIVCVGGTPGAAYSDPNE
jgi:mannose-6-phosphate isomerase-like protein (cupin superfamily)